jgi:DNA-binding transcriptional ArsR family regulator
MEALQAARHADAHEVGVPGVPDQSEIVDVQRDCRPIDNNQVRLEARSHWLERAARLPGKSMHLAVLLQLILATEGTRRVVLGNLACQRFGLNRNAKYRALRSLENAGLVAVERMRGRSPIVTIRDGGSAA